MSRTYTPRAADIERNWFVVDATGQRLGLLASKVAMILEGKHKPTYATHIDTGDHVIVLNAAKIEVSGNKAQDKFYARHSGYPGGFKSETLAELLERSAVDNDLALSRQQANASDARLAPARAVEE